MSVIPDFAALDFVLFGEETSVRVRDVLLQKAWRSGVARRTGAVKGDRMVDVDGILRARARARKGGHSGNSRRVGEVDTTRHGHG